MAKYRVVRTQVVVRELAAILDLDYGEEAFEKLMEAYEHGETEWRQIEIIDDEMAAYELTEEEGS